MQKTNKVNLLISEFVFKEMDCCTLNSWSDLMKEFDQKSDFLQFESRDIIKETWYTDICSDRLRQKHSTEKCRSILLKKFLTSNQSLSDFVTNMHLLFTKLCYSKCAADWDGPVNNNPHNLHRENFYLWLRETCIYFYMQSKILVFGFISKVLHDVTTILLVLKGTEKQCDNQKILSSGNASMHITNCIFKHYYGMKNDKHFFI